jgi:hypothetical protein
VKRRLQSNLFRPSLIERFFREVPDDAVRKASFASGTALVSAVQACLAEGNLAPERYVWKAVGNTIPMKRHQRGTRTRSAYWMDFHRQYTAIPAGNRALRRDGPPSARLALRPYLRSLVEGLDRLCEKPSFRRAATSPSYRVGRKPAALHEQQRSKR